MDSSPKSESGVGVLVEGGHAVDVLVDLGLGVVGVRVEVENGQRCFAVLDQTDQVLCRSDVHAADDPVDEAL